MKKRQTYYMPRIRSLSIIMLLFTLWGCESTEPLFDNYQPSGEYSIKWDDLPVIDEAKGLRLGGFTGLHYQGGRVFYTITDRGPVLQDLTGETGSTFLLLPEYAPRIVKLELQNDNSIKIIEQTEIKNPAGNLTSGKIPEDSWTENFTNSENINDQWGIYPSGLLMDIKNNFFWFADQYQPGLFQTRMDGRWEKRIKPAEGMRRAFGNHIVGGGLSGIDFTESGNIITVMGGCLENNRAPEDNTSEMNYAIRRIGLVNHEEGSDLSMFYLVEPESFDGLPESEARLGDIVTVNDTSYLVTEFGYHQGAERNLLFMVSVSDTTTKALVGLEGIDGVTFETLSDAAWRINEINPVKKTLLLDLSSSGIRRPEGIAIIDAQHVAIVDNNKYGISAGNTGDGSFQIEENPVRLEIFTLPKTLDLK